MEALGRSFKAATAAVRRLRGRDTHRPEALSHAQYQVLFELLRTTTVVQVIELPVITFADTGPTSTNVVTSATTIALASIKILDIPSLSVASRSAAVR